MAFGICKVVCLVLPLVIAAAFMGRPGQLLLYMLQLPTVDPIQNYDGEVEFFSGTKFTHHFVRVENTLRGTRTNVTFHYVEVGSSDREPIVFLHGIPDTWYLWHKQMISLCGDVSSKFKCLSFDVKGFGQSSKPLSSHVWTVNELGSDYRPSVVGDELVTALDSVGVKKFNLVSLDLSSWQSVIMAGEWRDRIIRYCKAQSTVAAHSLKVIPQIYLFLYFPRLTTWFFEWNPATMVKILHGKTDRSALHPIRRTYVDIPDDVHQRAVREFAWENNFRSWAGFYHGLGDPGDVTTLQTVAFRNYTFPVLLLQGKHDPGQPPEFYNGGIVLDCGRQYVYYKQREVTYCEPVEVPSETSRVHATEWFPNSPWVHLEMIDAGHFVPHEKPDEVTEALRKLLEVPSKDVDPPSPLLAQPDVWLAYYDSVAYKHNTKMYRPLAIYPKTI